MWGAIFNLLGGGLIKDVFSGVKSLVGDKEKRDDAKASQDTAIIQEFASENLQVRENRNWFDSLVDGLNRLPRPLGFFVIVGGVIIWPVMDPAAFAVAMAAYALVPAWLYGIVITIIGFYYTSRFLTNDLKMGGPSKAAVQEVLDLQNSIRDMHTEVKEIHAAAPGSAAQSVVTEKSETTKDFRNTSKPLSLPSIEAWNELNNPNYRSGK